MFVSEKELNSINAHDHEAAKSANGYVCKQSGALGGKSVHELCNRLLCIDTITIASDFGHRIRVEHCWSTRDKHVSRCEKGKFEMCTIQRIVAWVCKATASGGTASIA